MLRRWQYGAEFGCVNVMRFNLAVLVLTTATFFSGWPLRVHAADADGVALAIVYDTSGSMKEPVRDKSGKHSPKYVIANRALLSIVHQVEAYATNGTPEAPRKIGAALFTFHDKGAREAVPFGPFNAKGFEDWANSFSNPEGGTPLGAAVKAAAQRVFDSPLPRKHVLVITDGMNTLGPDPASVLPGLLKQAEKMETSLSVHFIAFDVDAKVFDAVKRQGAKVFSASDAKQLNAQLQLVLQREILLEEPEKPSKN